MPIVDALIEPKWIIPVEPHNVVLEDHIVAIKDGKIFSIMTKTQMAQHAFTSDKHYIMPEHVLMPGLVNAHAHSAMTLLRGFADDIQLMDWLNDHIWPAERTWLSERFVRDGTMLACAEMLMGGTTCFNDHYPFAQVTAETAKKLKMRCRVGMFMIDHPTAYAHDFNGYVNKELAWYENYVDEPLINVSLAPHSPYALGETSMKRLATLRHETQCPIHMHVHESKLEVTSSLENYHQRPIRRLADHGLLESNFQAVHCAQINDEDLRVLKDHPVNIIHCPQSNAKMASGICPVSAMQDMGLNVALGTDGAASNNDLDMLDEMQSAAFLAKQQSGNPARMKAADVIRMATLNGAKAMGLDQTIGSIEEGKAADLIAINMYHPSTQPVFNPIHQVVYACGRDQVSHAWIDGKILLRDGNFTKWPIQRIMEDAQDWGKKIKREKST